MIPFCLINPTLVSGGVSSGAFFLAVGTSGFAKSFDGVSWVTASTFPNMYAAAGNLDTIVAGGYVASPVQNRMAYSTDDAVTFATASYNVQPAQIQDAAANSTTYILTGYNTSFAGQTFWSSNGSNFTQSAYVGGTGLYKWFVSWFSGPGLFVTGDSGSSYAHGNLYSSTDGVTFSVLATCSATTTPSSLQAITYGSSQSLYVLVGLFSGQSGGTNPYPNNSTKRVAYSSDLVTWTQSFVGSNMDVRDVTYSSKYGRYVIVGNTVGNAGTPTYNPLGTSSINYSNNGTTWIATSVTRGYESVIWSPELEVFKAVSTDGYIATSTDGITWTEASTLSLGYIQDIIWVS